MLQAIGKNIICKAIVKENKIGNLLLTMTPETTHYEVISVGQDVERVKVGDIIFPPFYKNGDIKHELENYVVILEENVYAKL